MPREDGYAVVDQQQQQRESAADVLPCQPVQMVNNQNRPVLNLPLFDCGKESPQICGGIALEG
jgi:hypothetical protein